MSHTKPHTPEAKEKIRRSRLGKPRPEITRLNYVIEGVMKYQCSKCEQFMVVEAFYPSVNSKFGLTSVCKTCMKQWKKERRLELKREEQMKIERAARQKEIEQQLALCKRKRERENLVKELNQLKSIQSK